MAKLMKLILEADEIEQDKSNEELENIVKDEETQEDQASLLDEELDELRDILVDLDLNLYQLARSEKEIYYIVGKPEEGTDNVLMLVDTKVKEDKSIEEIEDNDDIETEDTEDTGDDIENQIEDNLVEDGRFDFITLPTKLDDVLKLNPIYTTENDTVQSPDHESLVDYLMSLLVKINPEAAEELKNEEKIGDAIPVDSTEDTDEILDTKELDDENLNIEDKEEDNNE